MTKDFDAFLALVPEAARPKPAAAAKPEPEKPRLQLFVPKEETPPPVAEPEATESAVEENMAPSEE
jgi:hypothetical protein